MTQSEAFPLCWPIGYKRTSTNLRIRSPFKQTADRAQLFLRNQVKLLEGSQLIISSNIPVRKDGGMYTDYMNKNIDDPGVAVYFMFKGKQVCMCCDKYLKVWENICALGKGIEALRGMERWGVSEFLDRAFTGFTALPESTTTKAPATWWQILGVEQRADVSQIKEAYRKLVAIYHPDKPTGNAERFIQIQKAYEEAI